ncbi:MAG TPA: dihydroneopterin aldolase [Phenylobacterium sp.]|nr:dihydroneopterin aldolase [Phenylobacterium sp.]
MKLRTVAVRDLSVAADIGVHAHEVGRRQVLNLNVTLRVRQTLSDRLEETFDYSQVVAAAQALARERICLIETFAYRLAATCLANPLVEEVDVFVEKPGALINGLAGSRIVLDRQAAPAVA